MYKNLFNLLIILLILSLYTDISPNTSVVCEENNIGNCILKWEVTPLIKGQAKVYTSDNPELMPEGNPVAVANISDARITIVINGPSKRSYYTMAFNDEYRVKVALRNVNMPDIQSFHDLGGYKSVTERHVHWGRLYHSAQIDSLSCFAFRKLQNLGIRTILDLHSGSELHNTPPLRRGFNVVHIPVSTGDVGHILHNIQQERIKMNITYHMAGEMNCKLAVKYQKEYEGIFDVLLDKNSYPVVVHCPLGEEQAGIVSALVLVALDVNVDIIMEGYRLNSDYFDIPKAPKYACNLPANSQEAIATLSSAKGGFLNATKGEIERKYGDVSTYLQKVVGLQPEDTHRPHNIPLE